MYSKKSLGGGLALILLGVWLAVVQFVPDLGQWFEWPFIIVGVGAILLIIGLLAGVPPLAVPACIVAGIGGILAWQNATGDWQSWLYTWALIPGFAGVGIILSHALGSDVRRGLREGGSAILTSLVLFLIAGSVFGALGMGPLGDYWPVLLILLGAVALIRSLFAQR
jgi:hypothetical protein